MKKLLVLSAAVIAMLFAHADKFDYVVARYRRWTHIPAEQRLQLLRPYVEQYIDDDVGYPKLFTLYCEIAAELNDPAENAWIEATDKKWSALQAKKKKNAASQKQQPKKAETAATPKQQPKKSETAETPKQQPKKVETAAERDSLPAVELRTAEDADKARASGASRKAASHRIRRAPPKGEDANFFDSLTPRAAVAHVRETMRELLGPLDGEDAKLFDKKWNAISDYPAPNIVEWLKAVSPIASEMVKLKVFIEANVVEYSDLWEEANMARTFGAYEDAEDMMAQAGAVAEDMKTAKARLAELQARLDELGEMPDPAEEKAAAAQRRKAAAKIMKEYYGPEVKIGGWYEATGRRLSGKFRLAKKGEKPDAKLLGFDYWELAPPAPQDDSDFWARRRIHLQPLVKFEEGGCVVVYCNDADNPKYNTMLARAGDGSSLDLFPTTNERITITPFIDEDGKDAIAVRRLNLGGGYSSMVYRRAGGEDLAMLPGRGKDEVVSREDARKEHSSDTKAKIYAEQLAEYMEKYEEKLERSPVTDIAAIPLAKDVYYVLEDVKELKMYSPAHPLKDFRRSINATDDYYMTQFRNAKKGDRREGQFIEPRISCDCTLDYGNFKCFVDRKDYVYYTTPDKERVKLDRGSATVDVKWEIPSAVIGAEDFKYAMRFWPRIDMKPLAHGTMAQELEARFVADEQQVFRKEYENGASGKVEVASAMTNKYGQVTVKPKMSLGLQLGRISDGWIGVGFVYSRRVMAPDDAVALANQIEAKYKEMAKSEWNDTAFEEQIAQEETVSSKTAEAGVASAQADAEATMQENIAFHENNIKFIEGTIARLKGELAKVKDESRRRSLQWQIVCEESNKIYEQDRINAEKTGKFTASRTPFDNMCQAQVFESVLREVEEDNILRREQENLDDFIKDMDEGEKRLVEARMAKIDASDPLAAAEQLYKIRANLFRSKQEAERAKRAMLDDKILQYEDYLLRAQRVKTGCDITLALGGVAGGNPTALKYAYSMACGYADGGVGGVLKGAVCTYSDAVDMIWSGYDGYKEGGWQGALKGAGWSFALNKGLPMIMKKVNWRKEITFKKAATPAPKIESPDVKAYKAEVEKARGEISEYIQAKNKINTMDEKALAAGKITDAEITKLRMDVVRAAAKVNANPTAKAILKYEKPYKKIGADFDGELSRVHDTVKSEFYKDMKAKGFSDETIKSFRNAASKGTVGMDADFGLVESKNMKIMRNGKEVSKYEWMVEGQKSWNAKYEAITGQSAAKSWENITTSVHPEAYRNMAILEASESGKDMRNLLRHTSLSDAQQIADVSRFKADEMLNGKEFPRLVYVREAARGTAKDLGTKFLPALDAKIKPLERLERMSGKHGKALKPEQARELERLRAARDYYSKVNDTFEKIGKGETPPSDWDDEIRTVTGGRGISETLNDLGDLFKSLVF